MGFFDPNPSLNSGILNQPNDSCLANSKGRIMKKVKSMHAPCWPTRVLKILLKTPDFGPTFKWIKYAMPFQYPAPLCKPLRYLAGTLFDIQPV
jgi:hypothetical protein